MYMIKELNDIIRFTKSEEIREDLVFTRDKLLDSLYEEEPAAAAAKKRRGKEILSMSQGLWDTGNI
jgi:hypothetical protein